jgi:hypothetical protein
MIERFSNEAKRAALERELKFRIRVYARRVLEGRMTQEKSDYEIGVMRDMLQDYEALAKKERLL